MNMFSYREILQIIQNSLFIVMKAEKKYRNSFSNVIIVITF